VIDSVRVSLTNQQRIVVLREVNAERYLPIWIGPYEAESITIALQEIEVARPQTHDLIRNIMNNLNARLVRVEVVALRDDVFFGSLIIDYNGQMLDIDTRPSDALALAVRAHVPILVSREVMDSAGIIPEQEIQSAEIPGVNQSTAAHEEGETDERLSVFKDFLKNLNIDDLSEDTGEGDQDPDKGGPQKPT
ncbi:MAG: bifunctional nuclease family protein, partial [Bellilinea sp.]